MYRPPQTSQSKLSREVGHPEKRFFALFSPFRWQSVVTSKFAVSGSFQIHFNLSFVNNAIVEGNVTQADDQKI
jgi:hypothetical protein